MSKGTRSPMQKAPGRSDLSGRPSWASSPPPMTRGSFGKDLQGGSRKGASEKSAAKALGHKTHKPTKKGK